MRRSDETVLKFLTRPLPDGATLVAFQDITADRRVEEALRERAEAFEEADKLKGNSSRTSRTNCAIRCRPFSATPSFCNAFRPAERSPNRSGGVDHRSRRLSPN